jgi:hypothetical protein
MEKPHTVPHFNEGLEAEVCLVLKTAIFAIGAKAEAGYLHPKYIPKTGF